MMDLQSHAHESLETRVSRILGDTVVRARTLTGGKMGEVVRMEFDGREPVVVKSASPDARLSLEADMLHHLRGTETVPVPEVIHGSDDLLILEEVPGEHLKPAAEPHLGGLLASLHGVTADAYGFGAPTLNGRIVLDSPWTSSWVEFYRQHRLKFAMDLATDHQPLPEEVVTDLNRIMDQMRNLLREPDQPSLLHGDLWTANVLSMGDRVTGLIDPSACYGDPEIELAYVDAWRSFGKGFWEAYSLSRPIDEGFYRVRRHVYALYPLLMHVYYFGDRFLDQLDETIEAIAPYMSTQRAVP